jgi:hypothetical protein
VKLFQIEEPDGMSADPDLPGVAIGIDIGRPAAEVAVAVGGNAAVLHDRDGFAHDLAVPPPGAAAPVWQVLFEGARLRAERALAQPATHAVVAVGAAPDRDVAERLFAAGAAAGLTILRLIGRDEIAAGEPPALAAAVLAEELAPHPPAA